MIKHKSTLITGLVLALTAGCGAPEVEEAQSRPVTAAEIAQQEDTGLTVKELVERTRGTGPVAQVACSTGISDAEATEWEVRPVPGSVQSSGSYSLYNGYHGSYVVYGIRDYGIDLNWSGSARNEFHFERSGGGTVKYGDLIAIRAGAGGYLRYEQRRWGINLVWSATPSYEWEVRGIGASGTPVPRGTRIRLFNRVENDNMVYCWRPTGINLAWARDCTYIPFTGRVRTDYCP